jgi:hypothetical protein
MPGEQPVAFLGYFFLSLSANINKMNDHQRFSRYTAKILSMIFAFLAIVLVSGACHRHVMVKYGGPPVDYKAADTVGQIHDVPGNAESAVKTN